MYRMTLIGLDGVREYFPYATDYGIYLNGILKIEVGTHTYYSHVKKLRLLEVEEICHGKSAQMTMETNTISKW